ncbi:MAG: DUF1761 domain-containing protein [Gammaproteobacteria bacterium]|nr:DUF1761 domain-containing protein [Gammaproteobacteria bacterium]MDE0650659.1 DUF1761 domain-containing protein [Gammaproteobacteria bacterium]MXW08322.1 DUF1761 domain-containing protein [Gammaproteobacteria bacterium]MYC52049.1 DUF1761 domain-containing protein [Gammaproteobacteria bacterium]
MHDVNLLAVLVAGIVPMIVGMLWYGPLFGKRWLALMETTPEEIQEGFNPLKTYGMSFLLSLVTAFILAQLIADIAPGDVSSLGGGASAMVGVHVGLMALVAFVLPVAHQGVTFEGRKAGLAWLNVGYNGVALIGQAMVIAAWGV